MASGNRSQIARKDVRIILFNTFKMKSARFDLTTHPKTIINFNQVFIIQKILGMGGFAQTYKIVDKQTHKPYALKVLKQVNDDTDKEVGMLKLLSTNPRVKQDIVQYYDYFIYHRRQCILMEYIDGETAGQYFRHHRYTMQEFVAFATWLCHTLTTLHDLNVVHHDVKPENIIKVAGLNKYKLIDFGMSCRTVRFQDPLACRDGLRGTVVFMAPELWRKPNRQFFKAADVYAAGVTLYFIITGGQLPYSIHHDGIIKNDMYHALRSKPVISKLIHDMVRVQPQARLTAKEAWQAWKSL